MISRHFSLVFKRMNSGDGDVRMVTMVTMMIDIVGSRISFDSVKKISFDISQDDNDPIDGRSL
jgi:uncharacterized membrane protein